MNAMTEHRSGALATPEKNYFEQYSEAAAGTRIVGDLLRFNKGDWLAGRDQDEVAQGTRLVANVAELMIGWVRWEGGTVTDQRMGRVLDGFKPGPRSELGDTDEEDWEIDEQSGERRDPWQKSNYLLLKEDGGEQLYTFTASAKGALGAIGELAGAYGKRIRQKPDELPVIELGTGKYKHKNPQYGWIKFPTMKIVGWVDRTEFDGLLAAEAAERGAEEDAGGDPPFDDAPAAPKKGAGKGKAAAGASETFF